MRDEILAELRMYLAADVSGDVWDEEPTLAIVLRRPDGGFTFETVPVGDVWGKAPVHEVLHAVAVITGRFTADRWEWLRTGEALLGVVLFSEGWGVSTKVDAGEMEAIQAYMAAGGRLADHPSGVECKMVNAVLSDGSVLMLTHFRGGETVDPNGDGGNVEGRVPDALREVLAAFQGEKV
jgi:hypothetical protein